MIFKLLRLISVLLIICVVFHISPLEGDDSSSDESSGKSLSLIGIDFDAAPTRAGARTMLSVSKNNELDNTALVAALDGKIHLVETKSREVLWSFASGPSIYSSYQAPMKHDNDDENASHLGGFYIDCGDDWALYMHDAFGKRRLTENIEYFISNAPMITDGGVLLGSKKTTVFLVDAKTGRLIYTYSLSDSPLKSRGDDEKIVLDRDAYDDLRQSGSLNLKPDEVPLYITRTDYSLKSYVLNSDKLLWNLTVSEIGAAFLCQGSENPDSDVFIDVGYDIPSQPGLPFNMPLSCQSKAVVYRFRNPTMLGDSKNSKMLAGPKRQYLMLPSSDPNDKLLLRPEVDRSSESHHKNERLALPAPPNPFLSQPNANKLSHSHQRNNIDLVPALTQISEKSELSNVQDALMNMPLSFNPLGIIFMGVMVLWAVIHFFSIKTRKKVEDDVFSNQASSLNGRSPPTKKKKARKSGKNNGLVKETSTSSGSGNESYDDKPWLKLNQSMVDNSGGRTIGKLFVSNTEIAKGSNGTIVLEGVYEGRPVAVKRLVKAHHDIAFKEIQNLIASDKHQNIVRWYGVESDQDFVYLSLERCSCSLGDLIQMHSDSSEKTSTGDQGKEINVEYKVRLDSFRDVMQDIKLWKENGHPSPLLLKLMRDVVSGVMHLHELGIVHRDLKPQNVLIIKEKSLCAKLSDMGISKLLAADMSSLGHHATGYGSSGWQAPEQLLHGRQTRAVDMFSLGCVLFYCLTGGRHPFGDHLERDINVVKNNADLFLVECIPESMDLFSRLLDPNCDVRPKASEVFYHPFFWDSELRLSFLRDTSDRVELEDREINSDLLKALESTAPVALVTKWDEKMEPAFLNNIGKYRRYKFNSVRDLLRVMRNKLNHYRELPLEIQEILGPVPEGFNDYFASRFPKLLIEVYKVMYEYCKEEESFSKYFKGNGVC